MSLKKVDFCQLCTATARKRLEISNVYFPLKNLTYNELTYCQLNCNIHPLAFCGQVSSLDLLTPC